MRSRKRKVDNGTLELKLLLRRALWRRVRPGAAVDLFAGNGAMLAALPRNFSPLHAVEKDPKKAARLAAALAPETGGRVQVHLRDNLEFVRRELPGLGDVAFLDFDAYGSPNRLILEAMRKLRSGRPCAVAVTDGSPLYIARGQWIGLADYLPGQTGGPRRGRVSPVILENYPALVRAFWGRLARELGFGVSHFFFAWKKGRRILYYGTVIEPR